MDHQALAIIINNMGVALNTFTRVRLCAEASGSTPCRVIHSKWTAPTTPNGSIWNSATKFVSPLRPITQTAGWPSVSLKPLLWYCFHHLRNICLFPSTTYFHVVCCLVCLSIISASNGRGARLGRPQWPRLCWRHVGRRLHRSQIRRQPRFDQRNRSN